MANTPEQELEIQRQAQEAEAAKQQAAKDWQAHQSKREAEASTGQQVTNAIGSFGEAVGDGISDMFSAEKVQGPSGGGWGTAGTDAALYNAEQNARGQQISQDAAARGQQVNQDANLQGDALTGEGHSAQNRTAPNTKYTTQYQNLGDSSRNTATAYASDAASSTQQDRQLAALNNFAKGPAGPSVAEAQLAAGGDAAQRSALSMARSGRGAGESASAMRDAAFNNATTQGTIAGQTAQLRAQESATQREQQLAALNAAMGGASSIRAGDATAAGLAQGTRAQDLAWQQQKDAQAQFGTSANLQQRGMNDAYSKGLYDTGLGYAQLGQQGELNYAQLGQQGALGYAQLGQNALNAQTDYELAQQQMQLDANKANQQADLEKDSGIVGMVGGAVGSLFSDERLKKDIKAEKALSRALGKGGGELETLGNAPAYSYKYKDPTMPGTRPGTQRSSMAQDLERGPRGHEVVTDTPQGKMVNYDEVIKLTPGALTEMNQRLQALEKSLGKRSAK